MKRWTVFGLVFLISSVLLQTLPAKAQSSSVISLEEQNVILPNSDVELISLGGNNIDYAMVSYRESKYWLFSSKDKGRSWEKLSVRGLPEEERFIALEGSGAEIALATTTKVFRSRDGGKTFQCLGGPLELSERGEAINSLAISGQILVGVWHPDQGKVAEEGVYLWSGSSWEWQGMLQKDVTSVAFLNDGILALASDTAGTYLQIGYPGQRTFYGIRWNDEDEFPGWPIEISQVSGQSPKETEILSSETAFSGFSYRYREGKIHIIYNTRQRVKDDVYQIELGENLQPVGVRKLEIPKAPEILSLDSISVDYTGRATSGILAVGVTTVEGRQNGWGDQDPLDGAHVYKLSLVEEGCPPSSWENVWLRTGGHNTYNCQVAISSDKTLFVGTSGPASCFGRGEGNSIIPISLLDASRGINQLTVSPDFKKDKTLFLNCGDEDILKVVLGEDYSLTEAQRVLYVPQGFRGDRIKIIPAQNQNLFIFERGTKRFWLSPNWREMEKGVEIVDVAAVDGKICVAGRDTMLYLNGPGVSSGLNWIQKIEPGPGGRVLVVGGVKEDISDTISLAGKEPPEFLPKLPFLSKYVETAFAPEDKSIYCGVNQLYRLNEDWQKITDLKGISKILASPQGLYVFCKSQTYFSPFPLTEDSQWEALAGEELKGSWLGCKLVQLEEKKNLLFFWDSSKIVVWTHEIPEEKPEEEIPPPPVEPQPVEPQPVEPEPVAPEPPTPPAPPVEPLPVFSALPWPMWITIGIGLGGAFGIYLLIAFLVTYRRRL